MEKLLITILMASLLSCTNKKNDSGYRPYPSPPSEQESPKPEVPNPETPQKVEKEAPSLPTPEIQEQKIINYFSLQLDQHLQFVNEHNQTQKSHLTILNNEEYKKEIYHNLLNEEISIEDVEYPFYLDRHGPLTLNIISPPKQPQFKIILSDLKSFHKEVEIKEGKNTINITSNEEKIYYKIELINSSDDFNSLIIHENEFEIFFIRSGMNKNDLFQLFSPTIANEVKRMEHIRLTSQIADLNLNQREWVLINSKTQELKNIIPTNDILYLTKIAPRELAKKVVHEYSFDNLNSEEYIYLKGNIFDFKITTNGTYYGYKLEKYMAESKLPPFGSSIKCYDPQNRVIKDSPREVNTNNDLKIKVDNLNTNLDQISSLIMKNPSISLQPRKDLTQSYYTGNIVGDIRRCNGVANKTPPSPNPEKLWVQKTDRIDINVNIEYMLLD